jgi:hypothetical protein
MEETKEIKSIWQEYSELHDKYYEDLKKADPATRAIQKAITSSAVRHYDGDAFFMIVLGILFYGMVEAGIYGTKKLYKASHWTKADRAMVDGRFDAAIEFIENSKQKDDKFKLELYRKVYMFATQEAGISDPDDPILLKLYKHGVKRYNPILYFDKGRWTPVFPSWKKKLTIKRNIKSRRQTRRSKRA